MKWLEKLKLYKDYVYIRKKTKEKKNLFYKKQKKKNEMSYYILNHKLFFSMGNESLFWYSPLDEIFALYL